MEIKNKGKVIFYILALMLILLSVSFYFQKKIMETYVVAYKQSNSNYKPSSGGGSWSSCTVC